MKYQHPNMIFNLHKMKHSGKLFYCLIIETDNIQINTSIG